MRLYCVLIGTGSAGGLERYADKVFTLPDLKAAGPARDVAGEIFSGF
jgi:hypothetical protein